MTVLEGEITAQAGLPTTRDAGLIGPMVTDHGCAALIGPPTVLGHTLGGCLEIEIPVWVCVPGPANSPAYDPAWDAIPKLILHVPGFTEPMRPDRSPGMQPLPCYTTTVTRRTGR
jgi:hypothetical protein